MPLTVAGPRRIRTGFQLHGPLVSIQLWTEAYQLTPSRARSRRSRRVRREPLRLVDDCFKAS